MCKSLIAVNMSLPSRKSNNVLTACQIRNWFWNCFNEAVNKFTGPGHLRGLSGISPNHLQWLCWPFINKDGSTHRAAVWLLRICKLWAWISVPSPTSEVPFTLDLFWGTRVCTHLPAVFPQIKTSNWKGRAGLFFLKSTREGLQVPSCSSANRCERHSESNGPPSSELCSASQIDWRRWRPGVRKKTCLPALLSIAKELINSLCLQNYCAHFSVSHERREGLRKVFQTVKGWTPQLFSVSSRLKPGHVCLNFILY